MKILKDQLEKALERTRTTKKKEKLTKAGMVFMQNQIVILETLILIVSKHSAEDVQPEPKAEIEPPPGPELPPEPGEEQPESPPPEPPPLSDPPPPLKIEMHSVISSNVAEVGYDTETNTMRIGFLNASTYDFHKVPENVYKTVSKAESVGSAINRLIRGRYQHKRWKPEQLL